MKKYFLLLFVIVSLSSRSQDSLTKVKRDKYETIIASADSLLNFQKYTEARNLYMRAFEIVYGDTIAMKYPHEQLKKIDNIFNIRRPSPQWSLAKIDSLIEISDVIIKSSVRNFNCPGQFDRGTFECYFQLNLSYLNYLYSYNPFNEKIIYSINDTALQRKLTKEFISVSYIFGCNGYDFNHKSLVDTLASVAGIFFLDWDTLKNEFKLIDVMYDNSVQSFKYCSGVSSNEYYLRQRYHHYKEHNIYLGKKNYVKVVRKDFKGNGQIKKKTKALYVEKSDKDSFGLPSVSYETIKLKTKIHK